MENNVEIFLDIEFDQDWQGQYMLEIGAIKYKNNEKVDEFFLQCRRYKISNSSKNLLKVDREYYADIETLEIDAYNQLRSFINNNKVYSFGSSMQDLLDNVNRRLKIGHRIHVTNYLDIISKLGSDSEYLYRYISLKSIRNIFNLKTDEDQENNPLYDALCLKEIYDEIKKIKNSEKLNELVEHELFRPVLVQSKWYSNWDECALPNIDQNFKVILDKSEVTEVNLFEDDVNLNELVYQLNISFEITDSDNKKKYIRRQENFKSREIAINYNCNELKNLMAQYDFNVVIVTKSLVTLNKLFTEESYQSSGRLFYYLQYMTVNKISEARKIIQTFFNSSKNNFDL
ncbi:MAG: hypothetical protein ACRC42_04200 [Mycoplasma sp.]